jgi:hypothetical protein
MHLEVCPKSNENVSCISLFMLLILHGPLRTSQALAIPSSRFIKIDKKSTSSCFFVAKCDSIFDELLQVGKIKLSHTIPPLDELKR